jgi:hypothetical protein
MSKSWFEALSEEGKKKYLEAHPRSKKKFTKGSIVKSYIGNLGEKVIEFQNPLSKEFEKHSDSIHDWHEESLKKNPFKSILEEKDFLSPEFRSLKEGFNSLSQEDRNKYWKLVQSEVIEGFNKKISSFLDECHKKDGAKADSVITFKFKKPTKFSNGSEIVEGLSMEGQIELDGYTSDHRKKPIDPKSDLISFFWKPLGSRNSKVPFNMNNLPNLLENLESIEYNSGNQIIQNTLVEAHKKIHNNLWSDLKKSPLKLSQGFDYPKLRSIAGIFTKEETDKIQKAINQKENLSLRKGAKSGHGRDYSVNVSFDEKGEGKAYFSAELPGCGNGDYYILLNPTTAYFAETD